MAPSEAHSRLGEGPVPRAAAQPRLYLAFTLISRSFSEKQ